MWAAIASTGAMLRWASYSPLIRCRCPGAATARTDRQLAGELSFRPGREGRGLFVPHMHPAHLVTAADGVGHGVEAVANDPVNALDACFDEGVNQILCHGPGHDLSPSTE
jgi:hypothetical protein